jgi:hypothetical protein
LNALSLPPEHPALPDRLAAAAPAPRTPRKPLEGRQAPSFGGLGPLPVSVEILIEIT